MSDAVGDMFFEILVFFLVETRPLFGSHAPPSLYERPEKKQSAPKKASFRPFSGKLRRPRNLGKMAKLENNNENRLFSSIHQWFMTPTSRTNPLGYVGAFVYYKTGQFRRFYAENGMYELVEIGRNLVMFDLLIFSKFAFRFLFLIFYEHHGSNSFCPNLSTAS